MTALAQPSPALRLSMTTHKNNHIFFFFNDTATTEIYTLSLHDALPICIGADPPADRHDPGARPTDEDDAEQQDRKSTRLNSSHTVISYAVFCLKKKNKNAEAA